MALNATILSELIARLDTDCVNDHVSLVCCSISQLETSEYSVIGAVLGLSRELL
jgi:hypothetical protein